MKRLLPNLIALFTIGATSAALASTASASSGV